MARQPEIACIVLSLGDEPGLAGAVASLLRQEEPAEIIVVNSGGGNPAKTLRSAGIKVRIVNVEKPLYAGGVRNIGIDYSTAPYIAFLAADCTAELGWTSGRLRRHRAGALAVSSAITNPYPGNSFAWVSYMLLFARRMPGTRPGACLHYGVSYSRTLFERFGRFREDLRSGEDTEFNGRLSGSIPIHWAPDVRTAHRHPTSISSLLRDQFDRGGRRARAARELTGKPHRGMVARNALEGAFFSLVWAWKAVQPGEIKRLISALPWIPPAVLAYSIGALVGGAPGRQSDEKKTGRMRAGIPVSCRRRPRILALLAFHNELRYLPGYFENVLHHVDGIIALDDGSVDGSGEFVARQPGVISLLSVPPREPHDWNEPKNQRLLIEEALHHSPDWLLAIDADERLEQNFRRRAIKEIARAERKGYSALAVRIRELWDGPDTYRSDGIWARKSKACLFKSRRDHIFNELPLHGQWAPSNSLRKGEFPRADLIIYHLKMIDAADRRKRYERYSALDPDRRWQAEGYEYLVDEKGLRLKKLPLGRGYAPVPEAADGDNRGLS